MGVCTMGLLVGALPPFGSMGYRPRHAARARNRSYVMGVSVVQPILQNTLERGVCATHSYPSSDVGCIGAVMGCSDKARTQPCTWV
jgi:hypothetical protein